MHLPALRMCPKLQGFCPVREGGLLLPCQVPSTARAMELGKEAAEYVSKTFVKPIRLEFEKARPGLSLCISVPLLFACQFGRWCKRPVHIAVTGRYPSTWHCLAQREAGMRPFACWRAMLCMSAARISECAGWTPACQRLT